MQNETTAARFGLSGGCGSAEGYVMVGDGEKFATALGMVKDPTGNVVIRDAPLTEPFSSGRTPLAAVAVDLMNSLSTRERSAGIRFLEELLHGWANKLRSR
ncbi:hypothetical protein [Paeniglutamicibacter sp.]|uniref:hypothetical protein n=1 Tax=Paeniglutamicibacter sp. TaxID=1934391 RepID=UPI00398909E1